MTVLAGFAFVAIRANLLGCYKYQNTFLSWKRILFSSKDFFLFYDETFFMMRNSYQNIVNLLNIFCAFGIIQVVNTTGCIHIISFGICLNHMLLAFIASFVYDINVIFIILAATLFGIVRALLLDRKGGRL